MLLHLLHLFFLSRFMNRIFITFWSGNSLEVVLLLSNVLWNKGVGWIPMVLALRSFPLRTYIFLWLASSNDAHSLSCHQSGRWRCLSKNLSAVYYCFDTILTIFFDKVILLTMHALTFLFLLWSSIVQFFNRRSWYPHFLTNHHQQLNKQIKPLNQPTMMDQ